MPTYSLYTAALVVELLEYCDEYEDESQEAGGSDTEMEEGERGTTSIAYSRTKTSSSYMFNAYNLLIIMTLYILINICYYCAVIMHFRYPNCLSAIRYIIRLGVGSREW